MHTYIIEADDIAALNLKIEEIKSKIPDCDFSQYDMDEDDIYEVIDELKTISMFDNTKVVLAKNGEGLFKATGEQAFELQKTLVDTSNENVLIVAITRDYVGNELFNKIKRFSTNINLQIKNIPLDEFAKKEFENDNFNVLDDTINMLIQYSGDMSSLRCNIDLLKCYKWDSKSITKEDIEFMITRPLDDNVYDIINAFISRDKKRVFMLYNDLKTLNIKPPFLISLLINKMIEMYNVYILAKARTSQDEIARIFNVKSGRAYYMIKNVNKVSLNEIKNNLDELINLDYRIKSGKIDDSIGLELFLLK